MVAVEPEEILKKYAELKEGSLSEPSFYHDDSVLSSR